jgi:hypothetical protein
MKTQRIVLARLLAHGLTLLARGDREIGLRHWRHVAWRARSPRVSRARWPVVDEVL